MDEYEVAETGQSPRPREWSCLRRFVGLRINLFRAMYTRGVYLSEDRNILAIPDGQFALVARTAFDVVFNYSYVQDCQWYRSDLEKVSDDAVPDGTRQDLLRRFMTVLS